MNGDTAKRPSVRRERATLGLGLLTAANAALYFVAAVLHLGVRIPLGFVTLEVPEAIPPATVVESLIGAGLVVAAAAQLLHSPRKRRLTRGAYVFALVGTVFGLTIALLRGLQGLDIWIHIVMLVGLAGGFILLAIADGFRGAQVMSQQRS